MGDYLVSVVIPTYKTNDSLYRAVKSVVDQTYKNIEIIVVDDNSPNSIYRRKAEEIMTNFREVKYIKHETNKNGSAARNTGLREAIGDYICFLDDDDFFYKNKIEKQINYLVKEKTDACTCFCKKNDKIIKFKAKDEYKYEILMNEPTPQTSSLIIKKDCVYNLDGFDETYSRHQDYEFLLRFFEKYKIGLIEEVLYERCDNGVNNIPDAKKMEIIKNKFLQQFDYIIEKENFNRKKIYAKNYASVIYLYFKERKIREGLFLLKKYNNIYTWIYLFQRSMKKLSKI